MMGTFVVKGLGICEKHPNNHTSLIKLKFFMNVLSNYNYNSIFPADFVIKNYRAANPLAKAFLSRGCCWNCLSCYTGYVKPNEGQIPCFKC